MLKTLALLGCIFAALVIGMLIGADTPPGAWLKHTLDKVAFKTVHADEECPPCPEGEFSNLTVGGATDLQGTVTIGGALDQGVSVTQYANDFSLEVRGYGISSYQNGFLNVYGPSDAPFAVISAMPSVDTLLGYTNYYCGTECAGLFAACGNSGAIAAGKYSSDGQDYSGAYLAALFGDTVMATAHVNSVHDEQTETDSGQAYLGALANYGIAPTASSIKVDTSGNIVIRLGAPLSGSLLTAQASMAAQSLESSQQSAPTPADDSDAQHALGQQLPQPDLDCLNRILTQQANGALPANYQGLLSRYGVTSQTMQGVLQR